MLISAGRQLQNGVADKVTGRFRFSATDIPEDFDAKFFANLLLRRVVRRPVTSLGEVIRFNAPQGLADRAIKITDGNDLIHAAPSPEKRRTLFPRHEDIAFLPEQPCIGIQDNDDTAMLGGIHGVVEVAGVWRVETAADADCFHEKTTPKKASTSGNTNPANRE